MPFSTQYTTHYLKKLKLVGLERNIPNVTIENAEYIQSLIQSWGVETMLEIGTANGYSTLQWSLIVPESGSIMTIEVAANAHREAVEHFSACRARHITALYGDAKKILPTLRLGIFDLVYIDAMKREYLDYLLLSAPLLRTGGRVIIDDVEKWTHKMENLHEWLAEYQIPYRIEKTDLDDSIMIIESE